MFNLSTKTLWSITVGLLLLTTTNAAALDLRSDSLNGDEDNFFKIGFQVNRDSNSFNPKILQSNNGGAYPEPIAYEGGVQYLIDLYAGSDKQKNRVILDTGSADLWFYAGSDAPGGHYNPSSSSTFRRISGRFQTAYADGTGVIGSYYKDTVALSDNGPSVSVQFGLVHSASGNQYGVLGLGYVEEESQVVGDGRPSYPNFPQALKDQGVIKKNAYSLYLNDPTATAGVVIFGGIDHAKYTGDLVEFPTVGQKIRFNIQLDSVEFGGSTISINKPATLDSGYTYTSFPPSVVQPILKSSFGSGYKITDDGVYQKDGPCPTGELKLNFKGIQFTIPNNDLFVQSNGACRFIISESKENTDLSYVLGDNFLRHAYAVYNLDDRKISLAHVKYTTESNISVIS